MGTRDEASVSVGAYKAPPDSARLQPFVSKEQGAGPWVEALWSTETAPSNSAKKGALSQRELPRPKVPGLVTQSSIVSGTATPGNGDLFPNLKASRESRIKTSNQNMQSICIINPNFLSQNGGLVLLIKTGSTTPCKKHNKPNMDKT